MSDDADLARRMAFIDMDEASRARLRRLRPLLERVVGPALDSFYGQVRAFPETRRFFADETAIGRAKGAQERHWRTIADAAFDADYEAGVKRIGAMHAHLGLEPRWYIGGYALLADQLMKAVLASQWPRGVIGKGDSREAAGAVGALYKAIFLDMDLAISVYLERLEEKRAEEEAQRRQAEARQTAAVAAVAAALQRLADGDLTARVEDMLAPEFEGLKQNFNSAVAALQGALQAVGQSGVAIRGGAGEIASASDDLSRRTEQQAANLEQTAAALEELAASVRRAATGAGDVANVVGGARSEAEASGEVVREAIEAMSKIKSSSDQIGQIIGVIDEIAFQTNLLALNAGVEAARAGDAGKGFAVVASEVRALAQRSAEAAREIKDLIASSTHEVGAGVDLVDRTGAALNRIVERVGEIDALVAGISTASREQATGFDEIAKAVSQMDQVTQQNAAMVEEATAAAHSLNAEVAELERRVGHFQLGQADASGPGRAIAVRSTSASAAA